MVAAPVRTARNAVRRPKNDRNRPISRGLMSASVVQQGEIIVAWSNPSLRPWGPRRQFWQVRFIDSGQDRLYQTTTTVRSGSPTAERLTECAEASEEVGGVARILPI